MPLPLIYHEDYSPEFPAEHRFPMDKFRLRECKICSGNSGAFRYAHRSALCPILQRAPELRQQP
ncbi:hypothetical protein EFJ98_11130 [Pseudomonas putida]|nr:hypothetical protein EFJ98_11130 [Pseudomonas putida]